MCADCHGSGYIEVGLESGHSVDMCGRCQGCGSVLVFEQQATVVCARCAVWKPVSDCTFQLGRDAAEHLVKAHGNRAAKILEEQAMSFVFDALTSGEHLG